MKAVYLLGNTEAPQLEEVETDVAQPGPGEPLIKVRAAA